MPLFRLSIIINQLQPIIEEKLLSGAFLVSTSILTTRLCHPPTHPDLVPRPHLIEHLDAGLTQIYRLTLGSAPAGHGKTTLVSTLIQQSGRPTAWLSLDENDNELGRFLPYLIAAFDQVAERSGNELQDALETSQSPQLDLLLTMLVNEIASGAGEFTLVLDDCHLVTERTIYEAIEFLLNGYSQPFDSNFSASRLPLNTCIISLKV